MSTFNLLSSTDILTLAHLIYYLARSGALGKFASILMEIEEERHVEEFINRGVTVDMIKQIDIDNSGEVDKAEFLCYMLVMRNTSYIAINMNTRRNSCATCW
jgi:hypothetical protein